MYYQIVLKEKCTLPCYPVQIYKIVYKKTSPQVNAGKFYISLTVLFLEKILNLIVQHHFFNKGI